MMIQVQLYLTVPHISTKILVNMAYIISQTSYSDIGLDIGPRRIVHWHRPK